MYFKKVLNIIFPILVIIFAASSLYAECYNEDACFKDSISNKGENLVVAVNRDTNQVELYWSDTNHTWLKPTAEEQLGLQKLYDKKVQLHEMQGRLDKMRSDTWYTTSQNMESRR